MDEAQQTDTDWQELLAIANSVVDGRIDLQEFWALTDSFDGDELGGEILDFLEDSVEEMPWRPHGGGIDYDQWLTMRARWGAQIDREAIIALGRGVDRNSAAFARLMARDNPVDSGPRAAFESHLSPEPMPYSPDDLSGAEWSLIGTTKRTRSEYARGRLLRLFWVLLNFGLVYAAYYKWHHWWFFFLLLPVGPLSERLYESWEAYSANWGKANPGANSPKP